MPRDVTKYVVDGEKVPSVTEVLDIAGMVDLSKIPPQVLEDARLRGTAVHTWIELLTNHPDSVRGMDPGDVIRPYIEAWELWLKESGFEIEAAEEAVVHTRYRYAGTYDVRGMVNGRRAITDYKARYGLTPEIGPQLAGYEDACRSQGLEPMDRYSLLLRPNGKYVFKQMEDWNDIHVFRSAVMTTHWKINHKLVDLDEHRSEQ